MKTIRTVAILASLIISPLALHASPGDAVAVIQSCGAPLADITTSGPSEEPNPQRVLHYRAADLHFQQDQGGWNFLYAISPLTQRRTDRAQTADLLPCFQHAMDNVQLYTAIPPATQPQQTATSPSFGQWLMQPMFGIRRIGYLPLLLLYILPSLIAYFRKAPRLRTIVLADLFLGWTIIGWAYALLLANEDPLDAGDDLAEPIPLDDDTALPASGMIRLNLVAEPEPYVATSSSEPRTLPPAPYRRPATAAAPVIEAVPEPVPAPAPEIIATPLPEPAPIRPPSFAFTPTPRAVEPPPPAAASQIHWTEQFSPSRRCRIEVTSPTRQVTAYEMDLTQRGFDDDGREYLGGYSNRIFFAFPLERVLTIRPLAA